MIGYGNFHPVVVPLADGQVSVVVELDADPQAIAARVTGLAAGH